MTTRSDPPWQSEKNVHKFLDYMATYRMAVIRFHASGMILCSNTDASYMTEPQERSCAACYFILGITPSKCARERLNGPIHVNCNILKCVAASAAESEIRQYFVTGRAVIVLRNT